jgi:hypothetical protein
LALVGDSGEAERLFRKESERHSRLIPNASSAGRSCLRICRFFGHAAMMVGFSYVEMADFFCHALNKTSAVLFAERISKLA